MANVLVEESYLQSIASAIRSKNELSDTYTPSQMAPAILNIPMIEGAWQGTQSEYVSLSSYDSNTAYIIVEG